MRSDNGHRKRRSPVEEKFILAATAVIFTALTGCVWLKRAVLG